MKRPAGAGNASKRAAPQCHMIGTYTLQVRLGTKITSKHNSTPNGRSPHTALALTTPRSATLGSFKQCYAAEGNDGQPV
eukprot:11158817-Alexandrium_andersonii.AAC.1